MSNVIWFFKWWGENWKSENGSGCGKFRTGIKSLDWGMYTYSCSGLNERSHQTNTPFFSRYWYLSDKSSNLKKWHQTLRQNGSLISPMLPMLALNWCCCASPERTCWSVVPRFAKIKEKIDNQIFRFHDSGKESWRRRAFGLPKPSWTATSWNGPDLPLSLSAHTKQSPWASHSAETSSRIAGTWESRTGAAGKKTRDGHWLLTAAMAM